MSERPLYTQGSGDIVENSHVAAIALGTADEVVTTKNYTNATIQITGVGFIPDTDVTGDDTDYFGLQLRNKGTAGSGTTAITAVKNYTLAVDLTAFIEDTLTLSTTAANLLVASGEVIALNKTEANSGLGLPAGKLVIRYRFV